MGLGISTDNPFPISESDLQDDNVDRNELEPAIGTIGGKKISKRVNPQTKESVNDDIKNIQDIIDDSKYQADIMMSGLRYVNFTGEEWKDKFPYSLIVLELGSTGQYFTKARYRLPINPQGLVIQTPFANKVTVTSRGILEESNGLPIKNIMINGTTGIFPGKPRSDKASRKPPQDFKGTVFGGTVEAAGNLKSISQNVLGSQDDLIEDRDESEAKRTGYYQYHVLRSLLEAYSFAKKRAGNRGLRLALSIPKDRVAYIVSPQQFTTKRDVKNPLEYQYTLQLKAWGTIDDLNQLPTTEDDLISLLDPSQNISDFQEALNSLDRFRQVTSQFSNLINAVRGDIESNIFGPVNQIVNAVKDVAGAARTLADFPEDLQKSLESTIVANFESLGRALDFSSIPDQDDLVFGVEKTKEEVLAGDGIEAPPDGIVTKPGALTKFEIANQIPIDLLPLNRGQQQRVDEVAEEAKQVTPNDINETANNLQQFSDSLEQEIAGEVNVPEGSEGEVSDEVEVSGGRFVTDEEWELLYATQDAVLTLKNLSSFDLSGQGGTISPTEQTGAIQFWTNITSQFDIPFNSNYTSKFAVPFPHRGTLERLAQIYLGDPTQWIEIAAFNNLKPPYIDEDGFTRLFLSNGNQKSFNISSIDDLAVGQEIFLSSKTQRAEKRKIQKIEKITDENFLITVDGKRDLSKFQSSDDAQMKTFLPNTVNSMKQIFIPSNTAPDLLETNTKPITFIDEDEDLVALSRIDWLLDSNGDLAVTEDGFQNLAFGRTNIIQAAKTIITTNINDVLLHPNFGAGVSPGTNQAEFSIKEIRDRISRAFDKDPRFSEITELSVTRDPGVLRVSVSVEVAQAGSILPIDVEISQ